MKYMKLFEQERLYKQEFIEFSNGIFNIYRELGYGIEEYISPLFLSSKLWINAAYCKKDNKNVGSIKVEGNNRDVGIVSVRIINIQEFNEHLEEILSLSPFNKKWYEDLGVPPDATSLTEGIFDIPIDELKYFEIDPKYFKRELTKKRFDL